MALGVVTGCVREARHDTPAATVAQSAPTPLGQARTTPAAPVIARDDHASRASSSATGPNGHARAAKQATHDAASSTPAPSSQASASAGPAPASATTAQITEEPSAIRIVEPIAFDMYSDQPRATSLPALAAVVEILGERSDIQLVTVTGHASMLEKSPQKLSERRATHVADALTKGGVETRRLVTHGVGADRASEERGEWPCRVDFKMARSATDG